MVAKETPGGEEAAKRQFVRTEVPCRRCVSGGNHRGSGDAAGAGVLRMHGWPENGRKGMASGLRVPGAGACGGKTWCRSVAAAW